MSDDHRLRHANLAGYMGADADTHHAIVRAVSRLPQVVAQFVVDSCVFFSVGEAVYGQCLPARFVEGKDWIIVVDEGFPGDVEALVAHEVAHAYLGHSIGEPLGDEETERRAREQAVAWGFPDVTDARE